MKKQVEAARNERQQTADSLSSWRQAIFEITGTLQGISEASLCAIVKMETWPCREGCCIQRDGRGQVRVGGTEKTS